MQICIVALQVIQRMVITCNLIKLRNSGIFWWLKMFFWEKTTPSLHSLIRQFWGKRQVFREWHEGHVQLNTKDISLSSSRLTIIIWISSLPEHSHDFQLFSLHQFLKNSKILIIPHDCTYWPDYSSSHMKVHCVVITYSQLTALALLRGQGTHWMYLPTGN